MKTIAIVTLGIAALCVGISSLGFNSQKPSVTKQEEEKPKLSSTRKSSSSSVVADHQTTEKKPKASSDWKMTARNLKSPNNAERLKQQISEMSDIELCKALDELASLRLSNDATRQLREMLHHALVAKKPEMALDQFMKETGGTLSSCPALAAFENFLKQDSAAATAWLDRNIAADAFPEPLNGFNVMLAELEKRLIIPLVKTNPAEAARRLNAMRASNKSFIIDKVLEEIVGDKAAFASFVRSTVPEDERQHQINDFIDDQIDGDFSKVNDYLEHFDATLQERTNFLETMTSRAFYDIGDKRMVTREDFENHRKWIQSVEPSLVNKATGIAIARSISTDSTGMTFNQAAAIAMEYHASGGGDDVLIPLLQSHPARWRKDVRESVLKIAAQISHEQTRQELLSNLKSSREMEY